jgi:hypothetical protein
MPGEAGKMSTMLLSHRLAGRGVIAALLAIGLAGCTCSRHSIDGGPAAKRMGAPELRIGPWKEQPQYDSVLERRHVVEDPMNAGRELER